MEKEYEFENDPFQLDQPIVHKPSIHMRLFAFAMIGIFALVPLFDFVDGFEPHNGFVYFCDCFGCHL